VPIKSKPSSYEVAGRVNITTLPDKLLYEFPNHARVDVVNNPERAQKPVYPYLWGGMNDKRVYHTTETAKQYGTLKSMYLRVADQLAAEGNIEKAEQIHDKLIEIFDPEIIPYYLVGNTGHSQFSVLQIQSLLNLGTPTATDKAMKIIEIFLDNLKETFDWFEKCDERTLTIQAKNIHFSVFSLSFLNSILSNEQRLLVKDKLEQIKLSKSVTFKASQLSTEIDLYYKKGQEAQRDMVDKMSELGRFMHVAAMVNDTILEDKVASLLQTKIDMVSANDPQVAKMFRDYFFGEE
jgi:hypothetical protein